MNLSIYGNSDKKRLGDAAVNVYSLEQDEYKIIQKKEEGQFVLYIITEKVTEPAIRVHISKDELRASINLYPGLNTEKVFDVPTVKDFVKNFGIADSALKKGAIEEACTLMAQKYIVLDALIAEGVPPKNGDRAVVEILFETAKGNSPKRLPDGRVDYRTVDSFIIVEANDLLLRRRPPTSGKAGVDVRGESLAAIPGEDKTVEPGEGVFANESKTEYRAKYNGQVVFSGNSISVLPVLTVRDVDMRVGNLTFEGAVQVTGNVLPGFSVTAENIVVEGIVENASLYAKSAINIKTGRKGVGKGTIRAGEDIALGYCENGEVFSGASVEIRKYCFNSSVYGEKIYTSSKDSIISGGYLQAFSEIRAANIGSKGTNDMTVSVGISPTMEEKVKKVSEEIDKINDSLLKISEIVKKIDITNTEVMKDPKFRKLLDTVSLFKRRLPLLEKKKEELNKKAVCDDPRIIVENTIRAGVKVKISNLQITLKNDMSRVEFFLDKETNEVSFKNY